MALPSEAHHYTYGDYLRWPDGLRCEIIDGVVYDMTPAPGPAHQGVSSELHRQIANFLLDKPCRVFAAPFDVRLPRGREVDEAVDTVVQPDIVVICDPGKIDRRGCTGAPDLVIEILSPHTATKDMTVKLARYERAGVREYWIVHPAEQAVIVRVLGEQGRYGEPVGYGIGDQAPVAVLEGLTIDLALVFRD